MTVLAFKVPVLKGTCFNQEQLPSDVRKPMIWMYVWRDLKNTSKGERHCNGIWLIGSWTCFMITIIYQIDTSGYKSERMCVRTCVCYNGVEHCSILSKSHSTAEHLVSIWDCFLFCCSTFTSTWKSETLSLCHKHLWISGERQRTTWSNHVMTSCHSASWQQSIP